MTKVLLVEDDNAMRESVADLLTLAGFHVLEAEDGHAGLVQAQTHLPDLIISDMNMPGMNGFELFQALCQNPATEMIAFILLTGYAEQSLHEWGMGSGIRHFLPKPFTLEELLGAINRIRA